MTEKTAHTTADYLALECLQILFVEDNPTDCKLIDLLLKKSHIGAFHLEQVSSPQKALQLLESQHFDVCLLDYQLGTHDGLEFLRTIHDDPRYNLPVIVLSGFGDFQLDISAMSVGAADFLDKSELSASLLERTIRYAIKHHQLVEQLRQMAEEDPLTGLQNAGAFKKRLREALARSQRSNRKVGLLFIDLDGFKAVNDQWGHVQGDIVLQILAQRIASCVRETDIVGRLGGDEFGVILEGLHDPQDAQRVCNALLLALSRPVETPVSTFYLSASIGISIFPKDATDSEQLLQQADQAMYASKAKGGNAFLFHES